MDTVNGFMNQSGYRRMMGIRLAKFDKIRELNMIFVSLVKHNRILAKFVLTRLIIYICVNPCNTNLTNLINI